MVYLANTIVLYSCPLQLIYWAVIKNGIVAWNKSLVHVVTLSCIIVGLWLYYRTYLNNNIIEHINNIIELYKQVRVSIIVVRLDSLLLEAPLYTLFGPIHYNRRGG